VDAYVKAEHGFQEWLVAGLGADRDQVRRNQRLVWTWDALSLALCNRWGATKMEQVPAAVGETTIEFEPLGGGRAALDPWPFAGDSVLLHTEGRALHGRFENEADLHIALDTAAWVRLDFELVRRARG
jgi:hypothetical protein